MTYIRYVAVGGFKSLRDWNLLELSPRVSVLVGGNGTGKSSLVEALLWALGEDDPGQLRAKAPADLVYRAPATATTRPRAEDILFHTTAPRGDEDGPPETVEASVYLVMGEEGEECVEENDDACCCKRRTDRSSQELPDGSLSVGRSVDREGRDRWELDGMPSGPGPVRAALARHAVDRATVAVIRQGELERILAADDRLRARIIARAAGIPVERSEVLRERRLDLEAEREWLGAEIERLRDSDTTSRATGMPTAAGGAAGTGGCPDAVGDGTHVRLVREVVAALEARERAGFRPTVSAVDAAELLGYSGDPPGGAWRRAPAGETADPDDGDSRGAGGSGRLLGLCARLSEIERSLDEMEREEGDRRRLERLHLGEVVARVADRADRYFKALVVDGSLRVSLVEAPQGPPGTASEGDGRGSPPAVAVSVTFPGQPEVHLDALSGGQRALVSFALGVAVLEETPSRLMVLDEVEPALDEGNLRRFNEVLQAIAATRQVVIVSHQRRTKEVGDVVFGVDHLDEGASGLLFRFEPSTRRLVVFGRTRGNWLDRNAPELQEDGGVALAGPRSEGKTVRWGR